MEKGKKFIYDRWQYTRTIEQVVAGLKNRITEQELLHLLERDIFQNRISTTMKRNKSYKVKKDALGKTIKNTASCYYEVYLENGNEFNVVFENAARGYYEVEVLYENRYMAYNYVLKPVRFELGYEVLEYPISSGKTEMFHCTYNDYYKQHITSTFLYKSVDVSFASTEPLSLVELARDGDYACILDAMSKYKEEECKIDELFEVYNIILKNITSRMSRFTVKVASNYNFTYLDGVLKEMRTMISGHYVICNTSEQTVWQECLSHHENFTYRDGKVYNGKLKEVTDAELSAQIISNIKEGEELFKSFQQKLGSK